MMTGAFHLRPSGRRHRVTTPDGLAVEVREWGDPSGPEVLLIPGVAQSTLSFVKQFSAPALHKFRIVSYDPRGHGLSDKPLGEQWYLEGGRWSAEVRAVMEGLGLRRPVVAGWSLGGRILRQYLVDYGDTELSGLIFLSCRPVEVPQVLGGGNAVLQQLEMEDCGSRIDVATAFLRNCFGRPPAADEFAFALAFNMLCPFEIRQQIGKWWTEPAISEAALRRVTVPTLIVHGSDDILVLPGAAEITARLIPHARLSLYDGCGHSVFFESADRFNGELVAFVEASWIGAAASSHRP
jgi:pimeloyl-ACP methyl ester carboxylesterase